MRWLHVLALSTFFVLFNNACGDDTPPVQEKAGAPAGDLLAAQFTTSATWFAEAERQAQLAKRHEQYGEYPKWSAYVSIVRAHLRCGQVSQARALAFSDAVRDAGRGVLLIAPFALVPANVSDNEAALWLDQGRSDIFCRLLEVALIPHHNMTKQSDELHILDSMIAGSQRDMSAVITEAAKCSDSMGQLKALLVGAIILNDTGLPNEAMQLIDRASKLQKAITQESETAAGADYERVWSGSSHESRPTRETYIRKWVAATKQQAIVAIGMAYASLGMYPFAENAVAAATQVRESTPDLSVIDLQRFTSERQMREGIIEAMLKRGQIDAALEGINTHRIDKYSIQMKALEALASAKRMSEAERFVDEWKVIDQEFSLARTVAILAIAEGYAQMGDHIQVARLWEKAKAGTVPLKGERDMPPKKGDFDFVQQQWLGLARALYRAGLIDEGESVEASLAIRRQLQESQAPDPDLIRMRDEFFGPLGPLMMGNLKPVTPSGRKTDPRLHVDHSHALAAAKRWDRIRELWLVIPDGDERAVVAAGVASTLCEQGNNKE